MSSSPMTSARVADLMQAPVLTCGPETPLVDVARAMADRSVHAVVVIGIELTPWSVVSARDVAAVRPAEAVDLVAGDVAATEVLTVTADASADDAARRLAEHGVDHAIVTDARGRPAGIISTLDLVRRLVA